MADEFTNWRVPGRDNEVAYSVSAMESMRRSAVVGLQRIPKRGLEIGGVLFGSHDGNKVVIQQWREIECEHASGPGFELSENDENALRRFLVEAAQDPDLGQLEPVGWYRTRTRGAAFLSEADVSLYKRFFPQPWQVALVIRPYMYEPALAGFFIWDPSGGVHREASLNPFELENKRKRVPVGFDPSQPPRRPAQEESNAWSTPAASRSTAPPLPPDAFPPAAAPAGLVGVRPASQDPIPVPYGESPGSQLRRSKKRLSLYAAVAFLVLLAGITLGVPALSEGGSSAIEFRVRDVGGQLMVEWNPSAVVFQTATGGSLEIKDGDDLHRVQLTPDELLGGTLVYERNTGNVDLGLTVSAAGAAPVNEFTRFLGTEPVTAAEAPMQDELNRSMLEERDSLQQRLDAELDQHEALQRAVAAEKSRLGM